MMKRNTTGKIFAMAIAAVMALTLFTDFTGISHAATMKNVKAKSRNYKSITVTWDPIKIRIQQEAASASADEETLPAGEEQPEGLMTEPEESAADEEEPAAEPEEPAVDEEEPAAEPEEPAADGEEPVAEPENPAVEPDELMTEPEEPAVDEEEPVAESEEPAVDEEEPNTDLESLAPNSDDPAADADVLTAEPNDPAEDTGDAAADSETPAVDSEEPIKEQESLTGEPDSIDAGDLVTADSTRQRYETITYKVYRAKTKNGNYTLFWTTKNTSYTNTNLAPGKYYFYKVKAYRSNGKLYATSPIVSAKVMTQKTAKKSVVTKNKKAFYYRIAANQKLFQYDTLQGACANGNYAYLTLFNRTVDNCKIVKVRLSDRSVVKVSKPLPIYHGNNLTYNTKKNLIAVTCCTTKEAAKNRVVMVSPQTLQVVSTKDIKLTKKVKNLPKKVRKKDKGYTAIAYNSKHNCYIARVRKNDNVVILNGDLKPVKYVELKGKKTWLLAQGMESFGDYIYDVRSFKGRFNYSMVTVHTMSGAFVGQMKFPIGSPSKELECIFHSGKTFYAGCYYSRKWTDKAGKAHVNRVNVLYKLKNLY